MTETSSPIVSAIVLNYRTPMDTIRCVQALLAQTIADQMEIIVVDNHSQDDSIGSLRNRFRNEPRVRIVEARRNLGYGQGNALGIRHAHGEYLLIINPDNELEPRGLERMVAEMEQHPDIGILAPQLVHPDGSIRDSFRRFPTITAVFLKRTILKWLFPTPVDRYVQRDMDTKTVRDVDWVVGACLLLRHFFYKELGGFDPRYFLFFDDIDLCRRCTLAGKRVIYFPLVCATDRKSRLSEGGPFSLLTKWTVRTHLRDALKYFWKWQKVP